MGTVVMRKAESGSVSGGDSMMVMPNKAYADKIQKENSKELAAKIRQDIESEFEANMNRKVQKNNAWVFKKHGEANPELKFDIRDFCATVSSDQDDSDTPVTQGGATS